MSVNVIFYQKNTYFSENVSNIIETGVNIDEMKSLRSESALDAKDRHASSQSPCQVRGSVLGPPASRDKRNGAASVGDQSPTKNEIPAGMFAVF